MKIIALSDTHNYHTKLQIPKCDVLIHAGDATGHGGIAETAAFGSWFQAQSARYKIFVAGNHDFMFFTNSRMAQDLIGVDGKTTFYLEDNHCVIDGKLFYGSPWTKTFGNYAFMKEDYELTHFFEHISPTADVLITHGPPKGILDKNRYKQHSGSYALLQAMRNTSPEYHFFGHIHEGYGSKKIGKTTFMNVSTCTGDYKPTNSIVEVDL